jgi:FtsP/CotA-like multicopper oxidase with cupredoxin domain
MSSCHAPRAFENTYEPEPIADEQEVVRVHLDANEVEWEIAPGRIVRGYGYNGRVPGPVIEAKQGVPLEVVFTNHLPEPTVIHVDGAL